MNDKTLIASAICMGCITGVGIISENEVAKIGGDRIRQFRCWY
jgi:hypothetical protein